MSRANVMYLLGFGVSGNAPQLNVDDPARARINGLAGVFGIENRLIQADGSLNGLLKLDVIDDVVPGQRLLNHQQLELVQPFEEVDVSQRVCGIRVAHQEDGWKLPPHLSHDVQVPTRLDLDLDTLIPGPDF